MAVREHRRTEGVLGRRTFLLAVALIAVQPTLSRGNAPLVAISDVLLATTLIINLRSVPRLPRSAQVPVALMGVALILGWFVTVSRSDDMIPWATIRLVGYGVTVFYLVFAFHYGKDPEFIQQAVRCFVYVTLFVNLLLLSGMPTKVQALTIFPEKWPSRLSGGLYDPNANGTALACCLLLVGFGGAVAGRRLMVRGAVFLALALCLTLTYSRGALVSLAVAAMAVSVIALRRRPSIIAASLFVAAIVYILLDYFGVIANAITEFEVRPESSFDNRVFYIQDAIRAFEENPFLGAGLGAATDRNGAVVHASLFWLLGDVGLLGFIGCVLFLFLNLRTATILTLMNRGLGIAGALIAMVVSSFSFEALYQRHWWILLGFGIALARNRIERDE
ncbi:O-antigen ligase family protein [Mycolicibacterium sp. XJ662]